MDDGFDVSVIIPTYNRCALVQRAIRSVLAQTAGRHEIIVVDDGSTDGTAEVLRSEFGDCIHLIRQANAGVSAARNAGLRCARAGVLALLDSDDTWHPDKTRQQMAWLKAHPDHGMVLCDVHRVDGNEASIDVLRRRGVIREDGWILRWILRNPTLVPASAMFRRQVLDDVGGFDPALKTAEDLDFHLRVASRWKVGLIDEPLVTARRGQDGLSMCESTYDDYLLVIERAIASGPAAQLPADVRRQALHEVSARIAKGLFYADRRSDGWRVTWKAARAASGPREYATVAGLALIAGRCTLARTLRRVLPRR